MNIEELLQLVRKEIKERFNDVDDESLDDFASDFLQIMTCDGCEECQRVAVMAFADALEQARGLFEG